MLLTNRWENVFLFFFQSRRLKCSSYYYYDVTHSAAERVSHIFTVIKVFFQMQVPGLRSRRFFFIILTWRSQRMVDHTNTCPAPPRLRPNVYRIIKNDYCYVLCTIIWMVFSRLYSSYTCLSCSSLISHFRFSITRSLFYLIYFFFSFSHFLPHNLFLFSNQNLKTINSSQ